MNTNKKHHLFKIHYICIPPLCSPHYLFLVDSCSPVLIFSIFIKEFLFLSITYVPNVLVAPNIFQMKDQKSSFFYVVLLQLTLQLMSFV